MKAMRRQLDRMIERARALVDEDVTVRITTYIVPCDGTWKPGQPRDPSWEKIERFITKKRSAA